MGNDVIVHFSLDAELSVNQQLMLLVNETAQILSITTVDIHVHEGYSLGDEVASFLNIQFNKSAIGQIVDAVNRCRKRPVVTVKWKHNEIGEYWGEDGDWKNQFCEIGLSETGQWGEASFPVEPKVVFAIRPRAFVYPYALSEEQSRILAEKNRAALLQSVCAFIEVLDPIKASYNDTPGCQSDEWIYYGKTVDEWTRKSILMSNDALNEQTRRIESGKEIPPAVHNQTTRVPLDHDRLVQCITGYCKDNLSVSYGFTSRSLLPLVMSNHVSSACGRLDPLFRRISELV